jgi:hypothetical protein
MRLVVRVVLVRFFPLLGGSLRKLRLAEEAEEAEETVEGPPLEALGVAALEREMPLAVSVQTQTQELALVEEADIPLAGTALLVKFGLGIESDGLFCKS